MEIINSKIGRKKMYESLIKIYLSFGAIVFTFLNCSVSNILSYILCLLLYCLLRIQIFKCYYFSRNERKIKEIKLLEIYSDQAKIEINWKTGKKTVRLINTSYLLDNDKYYIDGSSGILFLPIEELIKKKGLYQKKC